MRIAGGARWHGNCPNYPFVKGGFMSVDGMRPVPGTSLYVSHDAETLSWKDLRDANGKPVERDDPELLELLDGLGITHSDFKDFNADAFLKIGDAVASGDDAARSGKDLDAFRMSMRARQIAGSPGS